VYTPEHEERTMAFGPGTDGWVPFTSISHYMEAAVLACEDGRFHRHSGFDKEAIINSIRMNLEAGRFVRGASTISMQLAKNLYLPRTKTLARKMQEAILTLYLEQALTKQEILELYLNVIEYGPMVYGIGPASQHYFRTHASGLSLGQALYLGSILHDPKTQHFAGGGAVNGSYMGYLHRLMKILHKIHIISDDELDRGLRETVVYGSPAPIVSPPEEEDPYENGSADVPVDTAPPG
jgi:membrane carboxypeptidase/penicillin-binding protein PbpC